MADYYSVLSSAVAQLEPNVETARRALYERAREAVSRRMRAMEVSEDAVHAELAALNAAIAHIENDIAGPVEAALRAARPRVPRTLAVKPARITEPPPRVEPAAPSGDVGGVARRKFSARTLTAVAAMLVGVIIAALAYKYVARGGARPDASASSTTAQQPASPRPRSADARRPAADVDEATLPYILRRQLVFYRTTHPAGTIIIIKPQHFLYLVKDNETALRYTIGVGADCDPAVGMLTIAAKTGGPDQAASVINASDTPPSPAPVRDSSSGVPTFSLADTTCRIRATNVAAAIGRDQSSGGFQLITDDMLDLYERVPVGTKVVVMN
jgi:lipoprotein-anchoring transpeptidase ErfK/SrfK